MNGKSVSSKIRLDVFLVEKGWAHSRTHAQELIEAGQVFQIDGAQKMPLKKASLAVTESMQVVVEEGPANRFVSRGGLKLEGALEHLKVSVKDLKVLDVGISTGGFTDCLLQKGAASVLGVDVGHGQVSPQLLKNPRLQAIEGINARQLSKHQEVLKALPSGGFELAVMDVSFISIALIIPEIAQLLKRQGFLLSLVKPQFEVGIDGISKGGIVKDVSLYRNVENKIREVCQREGFTILDYFPSPIRGKDGNNEFFVFAQKT